ncbi:MAG: hypothetical protein H6660_18280 [Ardenticatenaceae bacterium]|nr:hypothetical protein [Ardenticatenaceae bacterium]
MAAATFIWLGSRRSRKHPLHDKGKLLDIATSRGLPVPNGGILLHELYALLLQEGVIQWGQEFLVVSDPDWLCEIFYNEIRFPRLANPVAVRTAFASGETAVSQLNIDFQNPTALANSLCAVWSAAAPANETRRDVLVMEMVPRQTTGTAVTCTTQPHDTVQFQQANTTASLELPKLSGWKRPSPDIPPFAQRLQQLLRGVRRTFGPADWQIEWADDGKICWLLQVNSSLSASLAPSPPAQSPNAPLT